MLAANIMTPPLVVLEGDVKRKGFVKKIYCGFSYQRGEKPLLQIRDLSWPFVRCRVSASTTVCFC